MTSDAPTDERIRISGEIFPMLSEEFRRDVVLRALKHRGKGKNARKKLNASLRRLRVDGYRDASRAPHQKLLDPILEEIELQDDRLAHAVLNAWMDAQAQLRDAVADHLAGRGFRLPEPLDARFESYWTGLEWQRERRDLLRADESLGGEPAGLMLCLVSQRFPAPPLLESPVLQQWVDLLHALPPVAPEWLEADVFVEWFTDIQEAKDRDRFDWSKDEMGRMCAEIREDFDEELKYLDIDPDPWPAALENRPPLASGALATVVTLGAVLEAYQLIRPQAPSRSEELERAAERAECEEAILDLVAEWEEEMARPEPPEPTAEAGGDGRAGEEAVEEPEPASGPTVDEYDALRHEAAALRDERDRLRDNNRGIRSAKEEYDRAVARLEEELSQSRSMEEHWRRAYIEAKKGWRKPDEDAEPDAEIRSVREAIAKAREMFPERLLIKLNSRSNEDTPFENPAEVFDVLAWLATAYRNVPHDQIAENCPGWSYKAGQSATTMGRFRDWYQTYVNGTAWELSTHVGKGNSHDPRYTIRIAFAWDEQNERVIVGFVGPHQRSQRS